MDARSELIARMVEQQQRTFGTGTVYTTDQHYKRLFGIPLESLALQYLYCCTSLPFGRMYGFQGRKQSGKSTLMFYFSRKLAEMIGTATIVDTENKASHTLLEGILGKELQPYVVYSTASSVDEACSHVTTHVQNYKKLCPSRNTPYMLGWDSLRGSMSEGEQAKVAKEGAPSRSFSEESLILSKYFASLPNMLLDWPIMLMFVQHEKTKQQEGFSHGPPGTTALGGDAPGFHATAHIRVQNIKSSDQEAKKPYKVMKLSSEKCNFGPNGRSFMVHLWYDEAFADENGSEVLRNYWFDWDRADCDLLASDKLANGTEVRRMCNITSKKDNGEFMCAELGFKNYTPASDIMNALRENKQLFERIQAALRISRIQSFSDVEFCQTKDLWVPKGTAIPVDEKDSGKGKRGKKAKKDEEREEKNESPAPAPKSTRRRSRVHDTSEEHSNAHVEGLIIPPVPSAPKPGEFPAFLPPPPMLPPNMPPPPPAQQHTQVPPPPSTAVSLQEGAEVGK